MKNYKEESRKNWGTSDDKLSIEQIQIGAILRIADAAEAMAKNHVQLQNDYNNMLESRNYWRNEAESLRKSNISLKGVITKTKNKYGSKN